MQNNTELRAGIWWERVVSSIPQIKYKRWRRSVSGDSGWITALLFACVLLAALPLVGSMSTTTTGTTTTTTALGLRGNSVPFSH